MDKRSLIVCGAMTLFVGGCTVGEETSTSSTPSPSSSPSSSASSSSPSPIQNAVATAESFKKPLVAEKTVLKNAPGMRVMGLLQSTDPVERARQVQARINKGEKDPFSRLAPLMALNISKPSSTEANMSGKNTLPSFPEFPKIPTTAFVPATPVALRPPIAIPTQPAASSGKPQPLVLKPGKPAITALPPLPEPTLAKAVEISGVIVVGGMPQAIVKAPNEATSRYVRVGQRLSNGQVLVKRIEMNAGSNPIVILEQNGVEVSRSVGDKGTPAGPTA